MVIEFETGSHDDPFKEGRYVFHCDFPVQGFRLIKRLLCGCCFVIEFVGNHDTPHLGEWIYGHVSQFSAPLTYEEYVAEKEMRMGVSDD